MSRSRQRGQRFRVHPGPESCLDVHPVHSNYFLSSNDSECHIFDMRSRVENEVKLLPVSSLLGHTRAVTCARFSPGPDQIVTGCKDGVLRLYSVLGCDKASFANGSIGLWPVDSVSLTGDAAEHGSKVKERFT